MSQAPVPEIEFSRKINPAQVPVGGLKLDYMASVDECAALVKRLKLLSLNDFHVEITVRPEPGQSLVVEGRFSAMLEQACVVTLEPVKSSIASTFSVRYISAQSEAEHFTDEDLDLDLRSDLLGDDFLGEDTEVMPDGDIDVGELATQYLSLEIDPYPRKPGAESEPVELTKDGAKPAQTRENPFAVLKNLKDRP